MAGRCVEDQFRIALVEAVEYAAERPALGLQERPHGLVGDIGRGEHPLGPGGGKGRPEQVAADATAAAGGVNHEKVDEVAAEEMGRPDDGESGHRAAVEINQALAKIQAASEEVLPVLATAGGVMIGAQDPVNVTGNRAPDLGLPLSHCPSLAYRPRHWRSLTLATALADSPGVTGLVASLKRWRSMSFPAPTRRRQKMATGGQARRTGPAAMKKLPATRRDLGGTPAGADPPGNREGHEAAGHEGAR